MIDLPIPVAVLSGPDSPAASRKQKWSPRLVLPFSAIRSSRPKSSAAAPARSGRRRGTRGRQSFGDHNRLPRPFHQPPRLILRRTGLRFQVHEHDSGDILYIQFHHAVCDGVGIFQLLHEILLEYAAANGPVEQKPWLDFDRWERARLGFPASDRQTADARGVANHESVGRLRVYTKIALRLAPAPG